MTGLNRYDKHICSAIMASSLLPIRVQVLVLIPLCAFLALRDILIYPDKSRFRHAGYAALLGAGYLLYLGWLPFTPAKLLPELRFMLEQKAGLFLLPFAVLCMGHDTRSMLIGRLGVFVIACAVSCLLGNVWYILEGGWIPGDPMAHVHYRLFFEHITGMHPTYMGMFLSFSIAVLMFDDRWQRRLRGWVVGLVYFLLFLFLMVLMPKAPLAALLLMLGHYIWLKRDRKQALLPLMTGSILAIAIALIFIPFSSQRIGELSAITTGATRPEDNSINMRQLILKIDLHLLKDHWLQGLGPAQLTEALNAQYFFYSLALRFPLGSYNTHNEYLNQWLSFGLAGLLLLTAILLLHFIQACKTRNYLYGYLMLILSTCFLTENVLSTQHGLLFYAFFTALFFFAGRRQKIPV